LRALAAALVASLAAAVPAAGASVAPARARAGEARLMAAARAPLRMTFITASAGVPEAMLAGAAGADPRPLGSASTAVLAPNGQFVAAVHQGAGSPPHGSSLVLYRVSKTPASMRTLRSSSSQLTILAWSPDSDWIAVLDGDSLVVVPLKGRARAIATGAINGASFAPTRPDRLVFAKATSLLVTARVNLYTVSLRGGAPVQVTDDGLSQYPLWGPNGIVFSREASHTSTTYQLWLVKANGRDARQLTNAAISAPFYGLEPVAISANGSHLLANLVGNGATETWEVSLGAKPTIVSELGSAASPMTGDAISRNGETILVTQGSGSLSNDDFAGQTVVWLPWVGGAATTLAVHAAFASWDW
jgi:WD40 repeat protein